jgi:hypothetical protein
MIIENGLILEFGDSGIAELILLCSKWLLKQRHYLKMFAQAPLFPKCEDDPENGTPLYSLFRETKGLFVVCRF